MPRLESFLHYRNVDVSSIKELVRRWYPGLEIPPKRKAHRAKEDILESIAELRFYRSAVFRP
jgi:oligoribonuclease